MRILIVEDNAFIAVSIEAVLLEARHEVVGIASNVESALAIAATLAFDLALVDYSLSDNSCGADAIRWLRDRYGRPSIFVSSQPDNCRKAWKEAGALGCLSKPFTDAELIGAVEIAEALINKRSPESLLDRFEIYGASP
jgi:CheY-like chemotaxis protein